MQIRARAESDSVLCQALALPGGLLAEQQRDLMPAAHHVIAQLGAEPASGKINEPPDFVQRLISRPSGHDKIHKWCSLEAGRTSLLFHRVFDSHLRPENQFPESYFRLGPIVSWSH